MRVIDSIAAHKAEMTAWRRDIHAHPELAFEEKRTSDLVAETLKGFSIDVHRGLAKTGVVGTIKRGTSSRAIALRADMDALPMQEMNEFAHRSQHSNRMHGCGHDGHTAMLLGAARYLAESAEFDGTVHLIFQPAEENMAGGGVMVRDGLFEKFPAEAVFGMHNRPQLPVGQFATRPGAALASADNFGITVRGHGGHAAYPHLCVDPIVIASEIVIALQTIVSRHLSPFDSAIIGVGAIHGGESDNVIPELVTMRGTVRTFSVELQDRIEARMREIATSIAAMHGGAAELVYERRYPSVHNDAALTAFCVGVAAELVGESNVDASHPQIMGSDDFAFMSNVVPGNFIWIGGGPVENGCLLHNPRYDFNDEILPLGATYWTRLVERMLPPGGRA